jgi:hypothetical protein
VAVKRVVGAPHPDPAPAGPSPVLSHRGEQGGDSAAGGLLRDPEKVLRLAELKRLVEASIRFLSN